VTAALALPLADTPPDYLEVGERVLAELLGDDWRQRTPELHDAIRQTPLDEAWVQKRTEALRPLSDGPMRLIPREIWHLSSALMQRSDRWVELWCEMALRTPRVWLVPIVGLAMTRADGTVRALDSHRAKSMLVAGVLAWQCAEYDPDPELPDYPFVIRGLPQGAWQHLLSYWEHHTDGMRVRVPARTTLFGFHNARGAPEHGECGYLAAWQYWGFALSTQPNARDVAPAFRGPKRVNDEGEEECWAFHELRLRCPLTSSQVLALGPPRSRGAARPRVPPPSERNRIEDLSAFVEECERSWYPDEEPSELAAEPVPVRLVPPTAAASGVRRGDDAEQPGEVAERRCSLDDERAGAAKSVAVWLVPPVAVENASAMPVDAERGEQAPAILGDYAEPKPLSQTPEPKPTVYGSGKLVVVRAAEGPISPRLKDALERFERVARQRDRGPPHPE
jgi:hypothetical protein